MRKEELCQEIKSYESIVTKLALQMNNTWLSYQEENQKLERNNIKLSRLKQECDFCLNQESHEQWLELRLVKQQFVFFLQKTISEQKMIVTEANKQLIEVEKKYKILKVKHQEIQKFVLESKRKLNAIKIELEDQKLLSLRYLTKDEGHYGNL